MMKYKIYPLKIKIVLQGINGGGLKLVSFTEPEPLWIKSTSNLIAGDEQTFGNIRINLYSLGSFNYKIAWFNKLTGSSVSMARLARKKYSVVRKWAMSKSMPDISNDFDSRKQALMHFFSNVDVIKSPSETIDKAKTTCLNYFSEHEGLDPIKPKRFTRIRLQGAIGKQVVVKGSVSKNAVVAKGTLVQIVGDKAEVRIEERIDLNATQDFIKFDMSRVFIV
jgi:hypothetical protein